MTDYNQYMQSSEWKEKKIDKLFSVGYCCEQCGYDGTDIPLDVHHVTYERLGHERLSDLKVLCRSCHNWVHIMQKANAQRPGAR